ncbi:hypothetical protein B0T19DRAFT_425572 [Cercophora scortea]|uniref:Carbohydrate-binding module family 18 protein n=1 Tax=Cercophora scortea TaxID=314031 RepID=A0AAE0IDP5_9PEZI|nr:hypothetical protein B0T19DRAFT_425572 [Cercophora scortea]
MRLPFLPRALATAISLLLLSASASAAGCTQLVTAQPGDTCASIAAAKGITVAQFIRSNPPIASCSSLVAGTQYCVDPSFIQATTTTSSGGASSTTGPLEITKDGKCGDGLTCAGSAFGQCCSEHGWCGQTTDHCGVGCQAGFGVCGGGVAGSSSSSSSVSSTPPVSSSSVAGGGTAIITATTTQTIKTTATQTVKQTILLTSTVILTVAATATTTQTLQTTKTQTVLATTPVVVLATSYVVLTSTAVVTPEIVTSTAVVTRVTVVTQNSIIITRSTITTIRTITITNAAECSPTGRETFYPPRATARAEARPALVQPGVVPECRSFYQVGDGDTCESIVKKHSETLERENFYSMNRQITDDCQGLWLGYWVCVGI